MHSRSIGLGSTMSRSSVILSRGCNGAAPHSEPTRKPERRCYVTPRLSVRSRWNACSCRSPIFSRVHSCWSRSGSRESPKSLKFSRTFRSCLGSFSARCLLLRADINRTFVTFDCSFPYRYQEVCLITAHGKVFAWFLRRVTKVLEGKRLSSIFNTYSQIHLQWILTSIGVWNQTHPWLAKQTWSAARSMNFIQHTIFQIKSSSY